jgi:hypothetical protein
MIVAMNMVTVLQTDKKEYKYSAYGCDAVDQKGKGCKGYVLGTYLDSSPYYYEKNSLN